MQTRAAVFQAARLFRAYQAAVEGEAAQREEPMRLRFVRHARGRPMVVPVLAVTAAVLDTQSGGREGYLLPAPIAFRAPPPSGRRIQPLIGRRT